MEPTLGRRFGAGRTRAKFLQINQRRPTTTGVDYTGLRASTDGAIFCTSFAANPINDLQSGIDR